MHDKKAIWDRLMISDSLRRTSILQDQEETIFYETGASGWSTSIPFQAFGSSDVVKEEDIYYSGSANSYKWLYLIADTTMSFNVSGCSYFFLRIGDGVVLDTSYTGNGTIQFYTGSISGWKRVYIEVTSFAGEGNYVSLDGISIPYYSRIPDPPDSVASADSLLGAHILLTPREILRSNGATSYNIYCSSSRSSGWINGVQLTYMDNLYVYQGVTTTYTVYGVNSKGVSTSGTSASIVGNFSWLFTNYSSNTYYIFPTNLDTIQATAIGMAGDGGEGVYLTRGGCGGGGGAFAQANHTIAKGYQYTLYVGYTPGVCLKQATLTIVLATRGENSGANGSIPGAGGQADACVGTLKYSGATGALNVGFIGGNGGNAGNLGYAGLPSPGAGGNGSNVSPAGKGDVYGGGGGGGYASGIDNSENGAFGALYIQGLT